MQTGSVLPLIAVSITLMFVSLALALDMGLIAVSKSQLQNAADSAALAGVVELVDQDLLTGSPNQADDIAAARQLAQTFSTYNTVAGRPIQMDSNESNHPEGGIVAGFIDNPLSLASPMASQGIDYANSLMVETRLSVELNGPLELLLGAFTGVDQVEIAARATASVDDRIVGFDIREDETLLVLPFSVYVEAWDAIYDPDYDHDSRPCPPEPFTDNYSYVNDGVLKGPDGIPEIKLYPEKVDVCGLPWAPGNFGTINIGYSSNSTADLARQILYGPTYDELAYIGGLLLIDTNGDGVYTKNLYGNTGVSNAIQKEMQQIKGEARILPLHRDLYGEGSNAVYEICRFVAVRVMHVHMTGSLHTRHIIVQPTQIIEPSAIVDPDVPRNHFVYAASLTR